MTDDGERTCPHCGGKFTVAPVAVVRPEHRLSFRLHPKPGEKLSAKTIGGTVSALQDLLVAAGKQIGAKTTVLVDAVNTGEDNAITFDLICMNVGGLSGRKR